MSTHETAPGELMRLVATGLAARSFDVRYPKHEDGRRLTIAGLPGMCCTITVDDPGTVQWEYWPKPGHQADPGQVVSLTLNVLAPGSNRTSQARTPDGDSLRAGVGQALQAAGLHVDIDVSTDRDTFTVAAEIVAASPLYPERGEIRIDDDGRITWECCYDTETVPAATIAETVVTILSHEMASGPTAGEIVQRPSNGQAGRKPAGT